MGRKTGWIQTPGSGTMRQRNLRRLEGLEVANGQLPADVPQQALVRLINPEGEEVKRMIFKIGGERPEQVDEP